MTFEEAKEILDKELCFRYEKVWEPRENRGVTTPDWENLRVRMAIVTMGKLGYEVSYNLNLAAYMYREMKLKMKEKDEPIDKTRLNESAKEFNDALLDEQAKRIKELTKQNKKLNDIIASRNNEIYELQEKVKKMSKLGKQIAHLNEVIGKKNAQLKDYKIACEEHDEQLKDYMISDKNKDEMISGLKKVNEGLRHKLADITISKVNEQALKSAESALVYKDKVIDKQKEDIEGLRKEIKRLKKNVLNATGVLVNSISKESAAHKYMKYTEEVNKGYAMDVYEQQKKLVEYVLELMDEIPTWVDFYSEWKEAENNFNNMPREELDKFFNEMFPNKFVW